MSLSGHQLRLITPEAAAALAQLEYRDTKFQERRLYTAWDNLNDERVFFRGIDRLSAAGIPEKHLMVYMLVGFDPQETWPRIWHRFNAMVDGVRPKSRGSAPLSALGGHRTLSRRSLVGVSRLDAARDSGTSTRPHNVART